MIDVGRIDELDGDAAADALVTVRDELRFAEAERFLLAAHWADLHAPQELSPGEVALCTDASGRVRLTAEVLPGGEQPIRVAADGTPEVMEFAAAELAALLGISTNTGVQLIADALNLRHRHPRAWATVPTGTVPAWLLSKVARRCAAVGLRWSRPGGWMPRPPRTWPPCRREGS